MNLSENLNTVPYMMTLGGQQFQTAYANIEKAMGCTTSITACNSATVAQRWPALPRSRFSRQPSPELGQLHAELHRERCS